MKVIKNNNNNDWINVHCINMSLSKEEEGFLKTSLMPLLDLAPSNSSFVLDIEQHNKILKGVFRINSSAQMFVSFAYGYDAKSLVQKLKFDLLGQIDSWKQSRFLYEAI